MTDSQPARACELLPCPFDGAPPSVTEWNGATMVRCTSCLCEKTVRGENGPERTAAAIERWNTRVAGGGGVSDEMVERAALAYFGGKMPGPSGFLEGFKISMKEALVAALQVKP